MLAEAAAQRREGQIIVGFAAEHGPEGVERARAKLERKTLDAIVVNDISRPDIGFDSDHNEVAILGQDGELHVPRSTKEDVAVRVLDFVQELRVGGQTHAHARGKAPMSHEPDEQDAYALFQRGIALLEERHWAQAAVPLEKAKRLEPDKTSIREALGRAYFRSGHYRRAASEFSAVVERNPANDYAHFCLGPLVREARRQARRQQAPVAGRGHATGPRGLPAVSRSVEGGVESRRVGSRQS